MSLGRDILTVCAHVRWVMSSVNKKQTFCPDQFCKAIVNMMEEHLCAHPLIPGYSHPSRAGIHEWAVKQMY